MGNILEEFWYGNINPQEQSKESNRAIKELIKLMGRNRDRLHDSMKAEQQAVSYTHLDVYKRQTFPCSVRQVLVAMDSTWKDLNVLQPMNFYRDAWMCNV